MVLFRKFLFSWYQPIHLNTFCVIFTLLLIKTYNVMNFKPYKNVFKVKHQTTQGLQNTNIKVSVISSDPQCLVDRNPWKSCLVKYELYINAYNLKSNLLKLVFQPKWLANFYCRKTCRKTKKNENYNIFIIIDHNLKFRL